MTASLLKSARLFLVLWSQQSSSFDGLHWSSYFHVLQSVTFMFHCFFSFLARSWDVYLFSPSFDFTLWSAGTVESSIRLVLFFVVYYYKVWSSSKRLDDPFLSQNPIKFCASHFLGEILGSADTICLWSLYNSQWITLPIQSCRVLYSICTHLLHSLIMWLFLSFLSPHNLHLWFCCVLSNIIIIIIINGIDCFVSYPNIQHRLSLSFFIPRALVN